MRRLLFLPFAALVALSGYLGWQFGQRPTETDVINFHANQWVQDGPNGAALGDCLAVPGQEDGVWLVVTCARGDTVRRITVAPNGRAAIVEGGPTA